MRRTLITQVDHIALVAIGRSPGTTGARARAVPAMVDLLAENPCWMVTHAAARLEVAFTTAARAIDRLVDAGIMERVGEAKRDRLFCATEILAILEEPAVLGRETEPGGSQGGELSPHAGELEPPTK